jgi:hypothetical protein
MRLAVPVFALSVGPFSLVPGCDFAEEREDQTAAIQVGSATQLFAGDDRKQTEYPEGAGPLVTSEADRAIKSGLTYLVKQQHDDGSFGEGTFRGNLAVTSLSALAMMASGSSPSRGPYGGPIEKAVKYVLEAVSSSGFIYIPGTSTHGPMYSHGFGTLFLAEAYGMTKRPEVREKLKKAVTLIIDTQNNEGGWRYQPVKHDADLSVTACQVNALRAARNAGLFVPKDTIDGCLRYVKGSQNPDGGFRYMLSGGASAFPRSAAGVVSLFSGGDTTARRSAWPLPICTAVPRAAGIAPATISTESTMQRRPCGLPAQRTGTNGIRRRATP